MRRVVITGIGHPLAADLENAPRALDGFGELFRLGDGARHGLLEVDVLAGLDGG